MEETLRNLLSSFPWPLLLLWIAGTIYLLGKGADRLVGEAVSLSEHSGLPKVVIGATIVSLGTTTPEAAVSVLSALQGNPGLALGNAVGSVICDTGLILGLAAVLAPLKLDRRVVDRQGWFQLTCAVALVAAVFPWGAPGRAFTEGGILPRAAGWAFLAVLASYLLLSVRWSRRSAAPLDIGEYERDVRASAAAVTLKLVLALVVVVVSARLLIPSVEEAALRIHVPDAIVAATLVAFGTSVPELATAVTAARRGHGELAVGNVLGADILNILFVAGAAAAVTPGGLVAGAHFFRILLPGMLGVVLVLRAGILASGDRLRRGFGFILLAAYALVTFLGYVFPGAPLAK